MSKIKCRPKTQKTIYAYQYFQIDQIGDIFNGFKSYISPNTTLEVDSSNKMIVHVHFSTDGEKDTYYIPLGRVVVFDPNGVRVISEHDFDREYERAS